jgi:RNA polymerase sporulation-specific sigma factor
LALAYEPAVAPYEDESDESLAERFQSGDGGALEELLRRHRGMACSKARSWFLPGGDAEDVIQEATIGIFKAARDYSRDHNVVFGAFAELCVKRQVITAVKAAGRLKHQALNGYTPIAGDNEGSDPALGVQAGWSSDPAEQITSLDSQRRLLASMEGVLSELEEQVLHLYAEGSTYAEIAETVGRHAKAVDNAVQRIRRKLGNHLRLVTPDLVPA